ncbi:hypothetical protein NERG_00598 [Nematocida ausubeli]|uniref:Uncharacterized protein n=1 Tax=Nematocida ausubeli (strain ATCC PRA-371 / ERTm2) TaxID=1913371 RepID=H8ZAJ9_NEMA1|nr:hypothetical protein NERG_00598 [Nematocida ausubeli]
MFSMAKSSLSKRKNQLLETKEVAIEDLRVHRIKHEKKRKAIWRAKLYMLIGLAILCHAWDRVLTVDKLINVQVKADTITEEGSIDSEIKPVLKEEASDIGFIHNKRFFSPEIKIEHSIVVAKGVPKDPIYTYTRDHRQDRVHPTLPYEGSLLKYKRAYFTTLLELFPSIYGYVSIWSDREDSFFSFINRVDVKEYKYKILASLLLLLVEGVDLPLEIDEIESETYLVLKKADGIKEHFRLNMNTSVKIGKDEHSLCVFKTVLQKRAVDVINFFIQNRENEVFTEDKGSSEPSDCDMHEKVQFIDSPAFLIQTYIRHCLESTKEVALFRKIVHGLLNEYIKKGKANPEKNQREQTLPAQEKDLFRRYFISGGQRSNSPQHIAANRQIKGMLFKNPIEISINSLYLEPVADVVPVQRNIENLSSSSSAHRINLLDDEHIQKNAIPIPSPGFTDYGETVLLGLFCTIAYNSKENIFTVDHIKSASEELKSFFRKHKYMYGAVSKEMHDDWNQVVGGLNNQNIKYMRPDRNQLVPGIINMLHVIKEIAGVGDTKKINDFRLRLYMIEEEQRILEVRVLYQKLTQDEEATKEEKNEMKLQILRVINSERLKTIRILEDRIKEEEYREKADEIKLTIQELMDIDLLYKKYIEQEEVLKTELSSDIKEYLTETIKKGPEFSGIFKQTFEESYSDLFGVLHIDCDTELAYYYRFVASFRYNPNMIELDCKATFAIEQASYPLHNKQFGVFERNALVWAIYEFKKKNRSRLNEMLQPTLFYDNECRNVDVHLLDPLMRIQKYKIYVVWALILYAIDRNLDSDHPFVRLADNLLESARCMDSDEKNEMFMLLSLISVDKYYPHITIDKHAYENEEYFVKVIEKVLELANKTTLVSHKTYANIITDILIRLIYLKGDGCREFKTFAGELSKIPEAGDLFVKILTLDGTTMEYITRVAQFAQVMGNEDRADCKGYLNMFLMWIIQNKSESKYSYWKDIVKRCCDLIEVTELEKSDFSFLWSPARSSSSLLESIKPIMCVKDDAKSVKRFGSIKKVLNTSRRQ